MIYSNSAQIDELWSILIGQVNSLKYTLNTFSINKNIFCFQILQILKNIYPSINSLSLFREKLDLLTYDTNPSTFPYRTFNSILRNAELTGFLDTENIFEVFNFDSPGVLNDIDTVYIELFQKYKEIIYNNNIQKKILDNLSVHSPYLESLSFIHKEQNFLNKGFEKKNNTLYLVLTCIFGVLMLINFIVKLILKKDYLKQLLINNSKIKSTSMLKKILYVVFNMSFILTNILFLIFFSLYFHIVRNNILVEINYNNQKAMYDKLKKSFNQLSNYFNI